MEAKLARAMQVEVAEDDPKLQVRGVPDEGREVIDVRTNAVDSGGRECLVVDVDGKEGVRTEAGFNCNHPAWHKRAREEGGVCGEAGPPSQHGDSPSRAVGPRRNGEKMRGGDVRGEDGEGLRRAVRFLQGDQAAGREVLANEVPALEAHSTVGRKKNP